MQKGHACRRDPVTGLCMTCGPSHNKGTPGPKPASNGWSVVQTHTYYGAGGRAPSPSRKTASPSGVHFADQRGRSPSPNYYSRDSGYDRDRNMYGRDRNMHSQKHGQVDPGGRGGYGTSRGGCWGRRRCCAILLALLLLLLLAGLAVGLYFGITAAQTQAAANAPNNMVPGGRYINGLYVLPVTQKPENNYWVLGADTPCNPYNNNTNSSDPNVPNCDTVTTSIVLAPANFTPTPTPTPAPVIITTASSSNKFTANPGYFCFFVFLVCAFGRSTVDVTFAQFAWDTSH